MTWPLAFFEFFVVIAFGIGWLILERVAKRYDKPPAEKTDSDTKTER